MSKVEEIMILYTKKWSIWFVRTIKKKMQLNLDGKIINKKDNFHFVGLSVRDCFGLIWVEKLLT